MSKSETVLVSQQQALWDYLDALLQEIPQDLPEAAAEAEQAEIQEWEIALPEPLVAAAAPVLEARTDAEPEPEPPAVEPMVSVIVAPEPVAEDLDAPPIWGQSAFQALLFKVNGLTLAVPLIKLHSVIPWPEEGVTGMPNQPGWCYGLLRYREQNVRIVDTATLVIPDDKRGALQPAEPRHVLIVGDGRWGLACSAVGDVVRLGPNEVKWRSRSGRRPWLAGTVLGHLCALMDTEAFAEMLTSRRH